MGREGRGGCGFQPNKPYPMQEREEEREGALATRTSEMAEKVQTMPSKIDPHKPVNVCRKPSAAVPPIPRTHAPAPPPCHPPLKLSSLPPAPPHTALKQLPPLGGLGVPPAGQAWVPSTADGRARQGH